VSTAADSGTCPVAAGAYAGGDGTLGDPLLITTPAQLQLLRDDFASWDKNVQLTTDIDMGGCVWGEPLGSAVGGRLWTARFDGAGHVVSGLDIAITATSAVNYAGFIGYLGTGGSITGLGFTGDVSLTVTSTGTVFAYAGGLVGFTQNSPISSSFATGDVEVNATSTPTTVGGDASVNIDVGGLVGLSQGSITDSYALGDNTASATVTSDDTTSGNLSILNRVGGLLGEKSNAATEVANSYTIGSVTTFASLNGGISQSIGNVLGAFIGQFSNGSLSGNVWDRTLTFGVGTGNAGTPSGMTGLTSAQMIDGDTFGPTGQNWSITNGFSAATTWSICPRVNSGRPFLSLFHTQNPCVDPPAPPPVPASAPLDVVAAAGDRSAVVSWEAPASSGSFPISTYQVQSVPGGRVCLVAAPQTSCEVSRLTNGIDYTFEARALTGAGWSLWSQPSNVVTPAPVEVASIVISGTRGEVRGRAGIEVTGATTGIGMGAIVRPWVRLPGQTTFTQGRASILVDESGEFTWQRRVGKRVTVYVETPDGSVRSNRITIPRSGG
jgi:hypothetical protein